MLEVTKSIETAEDLLKLLQSLPPVLLSSLPITIVVDDCNDFTNPTAEAFYVSDSEGCWSSGFRFMVGSE